jgi:hypothetical protein
MEPICEADDYDVAGYWGVQVLVLVGCFVVCLCVWFNVSLKMELEEKDENKMQTFLLTKHLFYYDNLFFLYIKFMLVIMFVLQCFNNNCVRGMSKFYVVLILSISHIWSFITHKKKWIIVGLFIVLRCIQMERMIGSRSS